MHTNNMDVMTEGLVVTILGVCIVFIVLLVIMGILSLFNLIAKTAAKDAAARAKAKEEKAKPAAPTAPQPQQDLINDTQLVAVITAAIMAASENSTEGTDGLVVKSIRRVNTWNKEAISTQNNF